MFIVDKQLYIRSSKTDVDDILSLNRRLKSEQNLFIFYDIDSEDNDEMKIPSIKNQLDEFLYLLNSSIFTQEISSHAEQQLNTIMDKFNSIFLK